MGSKPSLPNESASTVFVNAVKGFQNQKRYMLDTFCQYSPSTPHNDTTQDICHLQKCMRFTEPKRRAVHIKLDESAKPCLTQRCLTQELHHDPVSLVKYSEVTAFINKSPDKTLF